MISGCAALLYVLDEASADFQHGATESPNVAIASYRIMGEIERDSVHYNRQTHLADL